MQSGPTPRFVVHKLPHKPATDEPKQMVRRFVAQVGSIENARRALEFLDLLQGGGHEQRCEAA